MTTKKTLALVACALAMMLPFVGLFLLARYFWIQNTHPDPLRLALVDMMSRYVLLFGLFPVFMSACKWLMKKEMAKGNRRDRISY